MRTVHTNGKQYSIWIIAVVMIVILFISSFRAVKESLMFQKRDRLNIVFYGEQTEFYSLSANDTLHYSMIFYPDLEIQVPGGYGYYRVGALGKLVALEKNPTLFQRAFSYTTLTFIDYYFYPKTQEIYYGTKKDPSQRILWKDILFMNSNIALIDRIYLAVRTLGNQSLNHNRITNIKPVTTANTTTFSQDDFIKSFQGYLYQSIYRQEKKNVQLLYQSSPKTAVAIGEIIEGNGIRIADITQISSKQKLCEVKEYGKFSQTGYALAHFFQCTLRSDKTGLYDILFTLGDIENTWQITN